MAVVVLSLAGLVTLYGMIRRRAWGPAAGITLAVANVVSALIGAVAGWEGRAIGLRASLVAAILVVVSESGALRRHGLSTSRRGADTQRRANGRAVENGVGSSSAV